MNTNFITTVYKILLPGIVLSDTHSQYMNTNIITTVYTMLSPDNVLSDTHNQYTHENVIIANLHYILLVLHSNFHQFQGFYLSSIPLFCSCESQILQSKSIPGHNMYLFFNHNKYYY